MKTEKLSTDILIIGGGTAAVMPHSLFRKIQIKRF